MHWLIFTVLTFTTKNHKNLTITVFHSNIGVAPNQHRYLENLNIC